MTRHQPRRLRYSSTGDGRNMWWRTQSVKGTERAGAIQGGGRHNCGPRVCEVCDPQQLAYRRPFLNVDTLKNLQLLRLTEPRRTAGLRPAAASPTQSLSGKSARLEDFLRAAAPRAALRNREVGSPTARRQMLTRPCPSAHSFSRDSMRSSHG